MLYIRIDDLHSETFFEDDFSQINALNASYHDNVTANISPGNVRITGPAGPAAKLMESLEKSVNGVNRAAGAPAANAAVTANAAVAPGIPAAAQPAVNPLIGTVNPVATTPQAAATGVAPITAFGGGSANNLVMETLTKATLAKQAVAETKVKATEDAAEIEKKKKTTEQEQNKEKLK